METRYSIGELANTVGVPNSTIRYYERIGLIKPEGRTNGNYRYYSEGSLERLQFIRAAQAAGFTLDDITELIGIGDGTASPCKEVQELIENRLEDVGKRLRDLRRVQRILKDAHNICTQTAGKECCQVLDNIKVRSKAAKTKSGPKRSRKKS